MLSVRITCALALGAALAACGGSDSGGAGGSGGGATAPAAPQLVVVKPMAGVLHVEWTTTTTCDFIEGERRDDQSPTYAKAFEVAGDKTNTMDGNAAGDLMYTYRLRCKVGTAYSDYSNEMSANPTEVSP